MKVAIVVAVICSLLAVVQATKECVSIYGYSSCAYFQRAQCWGNALPQDKWSVTSTGGSRDDYQNNLKTLKETNKSILASHRTSPMVLVGCGDQARYVGGSDDFVAYLKKLQVSAPGCW